MKTREAGKPAIHPAEIRHITIPFSLKSASLQVKADGEENEDDPEAGRYAGEFEGYAAGILNIDRSGDLILPGAFADTLPAFLALGS